MWKTYSGKYAWHRPHISKHLCLPVDQNVSRSTTHMSWLLVLARDVQNLPFCGLSCMLGNGCSCLNSSRVKGSLVLFPFTIAPLATVFIAVLQRDHDVTPSGGVGWRVGACGLVLNSCTPKFKDLNREADTMFSAMRIPIVAAYHMPIYL